MSTKSRKRFNEKRRQPESSDIGECRSPFQVDRDRILYSNEFRRLEG